MHDLTESVKSFLEREEITFEQTEDPGVFKFEFTGKSAIFRGHIDVNEERRSVHVVTRTPVRTSVSKMALMAELIARMNHQILLGNFDLKFQNGVVVFRTGVALGESKLHEDVLGALVWVNFLAMDAFFPAIHMVVFGDVSPKEALEKINRKEPEEPDNTDLDKALCERLKHILRGSMN